MFLAVLHQIVLAPQMLQVLVVDGEIASEHSGGDFAAVGAVADENTDQPRAFSGERELHGAAETCRCCLVFVGPAIVGDASEGEVGLGAGSGADGHIGSAGDGVEGKRRVEGSRGWVGDGSVDVCCRDC